MHASIRLSLGMLVVAPMRAATFDVPASEGAVTRNDRRELETEQRDSRDRRICKHGAEFMHSIFRYTLGVTILFDITVALPDAAAQAGSPNACSLFDAAALKQLTKRKDILGQGPQPSSPSDLPKHMSACSFLDLEFTLTANMTPEWFARNRRQQEARPDRWKVSSVSGLGDEAYYMWDPRPGEDRNVGIVLRASGKQLAIGDTAPSDSIEAIKPLLLSIAKLVLPKMK